MGKKTQAAKLGTLIGGGIILIVMIFAGGRIFETNNTGYMQAQASDLQR